MVAKEKVNDAEEIKASKKIQVDNIKNNFFEKDAQVILTIYVKNLIHDHTKVEFFEKKIRITFRTNDLNFLKQYNTEDRETEFEWTFELMNQINATESKYKISNLNLELILFKYENSVSKWANVIKPKETVSKTIPILKKIKEVKIRSPSSSASPPPRMHEKIQKNPPLYSKSYYGFIGLQNLGNTCYMNAALQCLINLTGLRDYFIESTNVFQKEINTNNALGLNGKMAMSFAMLIRKLWNNNTSCIAPSHLRELICTKYAHFRGYEQQDTQEFMCSLLSILHEDLNRVLKKPFYENNLECNNDSFESTSKVALDSWQRFLTRENSLIIDNFYGQFKSKLTCPSCNKVSITFEPFSNFLVPLPNPKQPFIFLVIPKEKQPMKLKLFISEDETVENVINNFKETFEIFKDKSFSMFLLNQKSVEVDGEIEMIGFEFSQNWENIANDHKVPRLKAKQVYILYETENKMHVNEPVLELRVQQVCKFPLLNTNQLSHCSYCKKSESEHTQNSNGKNLSRCTRCFRAAYCNSECQKSDWPRHSSNICSKPLDLIGLPFLISINQTQVSGINFDQFLKKEIYQKSLNSTDITGFIEQNENNFEIFLINDTNNLRTAKKVAPNDLLDLFTIQIQQKKSSQSFIKILVKWNNENTLKKNPLKISTNLSKLKDLTRATLNDSKIDIHDCIKLFTKPETLTDENPWYCSNCKEHQKAKKQMSLWKLSKYLIITMKRFHANKASDAPHSSNTYLNYLIQNRLAYNKLNTFIDYPIKNLKLSQYIADPTNKINYTYDLCGIINHIGQSLYLGHYTAFSRTHDKNDSTKDELGWRLFDDAHVQAVTNLDNLVTQDAYVLVYCLRNGNSSQDNDTSENYNLNNSEQQNSPQTSEDEYYDLNSQTDESMNLNSQSNGSSDSLETQSNSKTEFTNLNDID